MTTADEARKEAEFLFWFLPKKRQPVPHKDATAGELAQMNADRTAIMALGPTAYSMTHNDPAGDRLVNYAYGDDSMMGEISGRPFKMPTIDDGSHMVDREMLLKILSGMTSDWVRFQFAGELFVVDGKVGDKEAAAMLAPRVDDE